MVTRTRKVKTAGANGRVQFELPFDSRSGADALHNPRPVTIEARVRVQKRVKMWRGQPGKPNRVYVDDRYQVSSTGLASCRSRTRLCRFGRFCSSSPTVRSSRCTNGNWASLLPGVATHMLAAKCTPLRTWRFPPSRKCARASRLPGSRLKRSRSETSSMRSIRSNGLTACSPTAYFRFRQSDLCAGNGRSVPSLLFRNTPGTISLKGSQASS